ncbi:hypothetical protein D3C72_376450 [compost metagenome]
MRFGDGELHALVLPDRAPEHHTVSGISTGLFDKPATVADAFGSDKCAFGIQPVEDVPEAFAFLADQAVSGDFQVVEEQFVGFVIDHVGDRLHGHAVADGLAQVDQKDRHAFGLFLHLGQGRSARQQDHQVGMLDSRDPHFLPVDHVLVAAFDRGGLDLGGIGAGGGLGHTHRLQAQFTVGQFRQVVAFLCLAAMTQQGEHVVHLPVNGAGVAATAVHFFEDHRGLGQPEAGAAIFDRNHRSQPTGVGQSLDEGFREAFFFVDFAPVSGIEFSTQGAYAFADGIEFIRVAVGHYYSPQRVTHGISPA